MNPATKAELPDASPEGGKRICESYAFSVFAIADGEDRAGLSQFCFGCSLLLNIHHPFLLSPHMLLTPLNYHDE